MGTQLAIGEVVRGQNQVVRGLQDRLRVGEDVELAAAAKSEYTYLWQSRQRNCSQATDSSQFSALRTNIEPFTGPTYIKQFWHLSTYTYALMAREYLREIIQKPDFAIDE